MSVRLFPKWIDASAITTSKFVRSFNIVHEALHILWVQKQNRLKIYDIPFCGTNWTCFVTRILFITSWWSNSPRYLAGVTW